MYLASPVQGAGNQASGSITVIRINQNVTVRQSILSLIGAVAVSIFAFGVTTASGPIATPVAAAPMA